MPVGMKSVLNKRNELSAGAARRNLENRRNRALGWRGLGLIRSVLLLSPLILGVGCKHQFLACEVE